MYDFISMMEKVYRYLQLHYQSILLLYLIFAAKNCWTCLEKSVPVWYQSKIIREAQHYCQDNQQQIRLILAELQNLMTNHFPIDTRLRYLHYFPYHMVEA